MEFSLHSGFLKKIPFEKILKNISNEAVDLLSKLLELDYSKRITVEDALKHSYLSNLHNEFDEVIELYLKSLAN